MLGHLLDHLTQGSHVALISAEIKCFLKHPALKLSCYIILYTLTEFSSLR